VIEIYQTEVGIYFSPQVNRDFFISDTEKFSYIERKFLNYVNYAILAIGVRILIKTRSKLRHLYEI